MKKIILMFILFISFNVEANDIKTLEKGCNANNPKSCSNLALIYMTGKGVKKDINKVKELLEKACGTNYPEACYNLGQIYWTSKNIEKAEPLFNKSCKNKYADACYALGDIYRMGEFRDVNLEKSYSFYEKSCSYNNHQGCHNIASMNESGTGTPKNIDKARKIYKQACDKDTLESCVNLGVMYSLGKIKGKDEKDANRLFKKACDKGNIKGCSALQHKNKLEDKCINGASAGGPCLAIGLLSIESGDFKKARKFFIESCKNKEKDGCKALKTLDEMQKTSPKNNQKTECNSNLFQAYEKGYDYGLKGDFVEKYKDFLMMRAFCKSTGKMLAAGKKSDPQLYITACEGGAAVASEKLKKLSCEELTKRLSEEF